MVARDDRQQLPLKRGQPRPRHDAPTDDGDLVARDRREIADLGGRKAKTDRKRRGLDAFCAGLLQQLCEALARRKPGTPGTRTFRRVWIGDHAAADRVERRRRSDHESIAGAQHDGSSSTRRAANGRDGSITRARRCARRPPRSRRESETTFAAGPRLRVGNERHVGARERRRTPIAIGDDRRAARHVGDVDARERDRRAAACSRDVELRAVPLNAADTRRVRRREECERSHRARCDRTTRSR